MIPIFITSQILAIAVVAALFFMLMREKSNIEMLEDDIKDLNESFDFHLKANSDNIKDIKQRLVKAESDLSRISSEHTQINEGIEAICEHLNVKLEHRKHSRFVSKK